MGLEQQSFEDRKERIFDFMDEVHKKREEENRIMEIENRPETKLRKLNVTKKDGVDQCLNTVLGTLYRNSIPTNSLLPQNTCINGSIQHLQNPMELQDEMKDFVTGRANGQGASYYVHEAIKRTNSPALKKLLEGCTRIVNEQYEGKVADPNTITKDDYAFKLSGESEEKLNDLMDSLQLTDLSEVIKQNVKTTAVNEIEAAKKEKEERDALENELAGNNDLTTESAITRYLAENNLQKPQGFYQPSLFEGILIGKFNTLPHMESVEEGPIENVEYMAEKVLGKLRDAFRPQEQKELLEDFKTFEGAFGRMLGFYKSDIKSKNHNEVISNCKSGLTSKRISPNVTFTLPDIAKITAELDAVKTECKQALKEPDKRNANVKAVSITKRSYTIIEALKQYDSSVKFLNGYFANPEKKLQESLKKYQAVEEGAKKLCTTKKDLKTVENALSGVLMADSTLVMLHIKYVQGVSELSGKIAREASRMTAKEAAFEEAVKEYTKLSCIKALRLEDFPVTTVKRMATQYAEM